MGIQLLLSFQLTTTKKASSRPELWYKISLIKSLFCHQRSARVPHTLRIFFFFLILKKYLNQQSPDFWLSIQNQMSATTTTPTGSTDVRETVTLSAVGSHPCCNVAPEQSHCSWVMSATTLQQWCNNPGICELIWIPTGTLIGSHRWL